MVQNYQKQKLPSAKLVQVSILTGLSGQPAQLSAPVVSLVDTSTMIVVLNQLSKSVLVVRIDGHFGPLGLPAHQHVLELVFVVKSTTAELNLLLKKRDVELAVLI